ncbi:hypothetical protein H4O18_21510 [Arenibacter sp. BSSL-BM3]|uniref:DAGKc domain-containing protein n=1 Tax=Arenibacter arenosicollis TaxID=2762274 RepID=A0ABR7QTU1_9FLAO|nr:diacylglycerol kinase family protein [Arenibacter arenosicollis]MBC8770583.1 hypothetical protein [Arenibacter arenosicollis]
MKTAQLIHNPTAGTAAHCKDELLTIVRKAGYKADYISTQNLEVWENFNPNEAEVIFLAGGDGTVHKLAEKLLLKMKDKSVPIHLLPMGTANNIARTLKIPTVLEGHTLNQKRSIMNFDYGSVKGLPNKEFLLESAGFGVFPHLIHKMKKNNDKNLAPQDELNLAIKVLLKIVTKFKAQKATIKADGIKIKGKFILIELMNIQYLGPNVKLAPHANPGDGHFELVLIPEKARDGLKNYLNEMVNGKSDNLSLGKFVKTIRVRSIKLKWAGNKMHVDDSLINDYSAKKIKIKVLPSALSFYTNI